MGPTNKKNLRESARAPLSASLTYTCEGKTGDGVVKNISAVGIFAECRERFEAGSMMDVRIVLPGMAGTIEAMVWVIWSKEGEGFGAQFMNLNEKAREIIEDFVTGALIRPASTDLRSTGGAA